MNIFREELTGKSEDLLRTEIMFFIATAKAIKKDLICLSVKKLYDDKREISRIGAIGRILRNVKRQGMVQLFAFSSDFEKSTTEVEYLKNKYPELSSVCAEDNCYILKL